MHDHYTYLIQLRGPVNESDLNTLTPLQMTVVQVDTATTVVTVSTDQSGLIGLMRHLHGLGFQFLSVCAAGEVSPHPRHPHRLH